jgi:4a-hydroxytetrahydrobiopterin dehydratase
VGYASLYKEIGKTMASESKGKKRPAATWDVVAGKLHREFNFTNFRDAFSFMMRVAFECEAMDHHPEWQNSYGVVKILIWTTSENSITALDHKLAKAISDIYDAMYPG